MDKIDRGKKHTCSECMCKFYDFNKDIVICPKCGKEQILPKVVKQTIHNATSAINEEENTENNNLEEEVLFDEMDENITKPEEDL